MIYDKASLAQIPSGVGVNTLFSVVPNTSTGDFDYTGGTNGTRVNKDGLIETIPANVPRLNYPLLNGVVQNNPVVLTEDNMTNNFTYSESNSGKTLTNVTLENNMGVAPDGSYNALKMTENTSNGRHRFQTPNFFVSGSLKYAISFFVKKNSENRYVFINAGTLLNASGSFDLDTGATTGSVQLFETYPNGWYRIGIHAQPSSTNTNVAFIQMQKGTSDEDYVGDGSSCFLWGFQFEENFNGQTSYIPNLSSGTTTRAADTATDAQAEFNSLEGVLYVNAKAGNTDNLSDAVAFTLSDGFTSLPIMDNAVAIEYSLLSNVVTGRSRINGSTVPLVATAISTSADVYTFNKIAYQYKENEYKMFFNGFKLGQVDYSDIFEEGDLEEVNFRGLSSGTDFYGETKELIAFSGGMTDEELETLTSYRSFKDMAKELLFTIE